MIAPLDPDGRRLAAGFHPRALRLSRRFVRRYPWLRDELESAVGLACVEAAGSYDPAGAAFETFAHRRVLSRLCGVVRGDRRSRPRWRGSPADLVADPIPADRSGEEAEAFAALIGRAEPRDREILLRIYRDGRTQREVASDLGIWQSNVAKAHARGLARIKERTCLS